MQATGYLMAIDAGTGSVRAVIFDTNGVQVSVAQREWTHHTDPHIPHSMNFDLTKNWQLTCECISESIQQAGISSQAILAISTCSMREGIVLYDQQKKPIWACGNVDARATQEVNKLKALHQNRFEEEVYHLSGQTLALSAIPRLLWLAEHQPECYAKVRYLTMISDWLGFMLTNELAVEPSNAGTTGIINLATRKWAPELLERAGLNPNILPTVKETGTLLGKVRADVAQLTGLAENTPVVVGGGDVQLGCIGLGVTEANQAAVIGGTFWQQVVNLPHIMTDPTMNVRINPHTIAPLVQAESISFFTGLTMRWFRDVFCVEEKKQAQQQGIDAYTLLEEKAAQQPVGANGIVPIFSDAMHFNCWYHAAPSFVNLSIDPQKCNKFTLFRALEENAAIVAASNLEQVQQFSGVTLSSIVFAGGGAKGRLWSQILADVTGLTVNIPEVKEATALGCAIAAGVGVGVYSSLSEAGKKLVRIERTHQPNWHNHQIYQQHKQQWQAIYAKQKQLVDLGFTTPLWKAPGL